MDETEMGVEYAFVTGLVASITQNVKQTKMSNKLMPYVAIVLGALIGLCYAAVKGNGNYVVGTVVGLGAGVSASGLFDGVKGIASLFTKSKTEPTVYELPTSNPTQADQ